ncbi:MAG: hypothetical protein ACREJN_02975 [Nitrospiraceae bacterium]
MDSAKKPYTAPQLFRVDLSPEQAILSACSLMAMTAQNGGGGNCRPQNGCKKAKAAGDSAARPS